LLLLAILFLLAAFVAGMPTPQGSFQSIAQRVTPIIPPR
jgi:hypothetical protein